MGNRVSRAVAGCFVPSDSYGRRHHQHHDRPPAYYFGGGYNTSEPLDEGLGHSFCYVRPPASDAGHLSPKSHSDRFPLPLAAISSSSATATAIATDPDPDTSSSSFPAVSTDTSSATNNYRAETSSASAAFKSISGASVSANTSTPRTLICHEQFHSFTNVPDDRHAAFESTSSFASIPLQPVPRGFSLSGPISAPISGSLQESSLAGDEHLQHRGFMSGPLERSFMSERGFMSGPFERGFMSGPLERGYMSGPFENSIPADQTHFSAPLAGPYHLWRMRKQRKFARMLESVGKPVREALTRTISSTLTRTRRSLVAPVRQFVWRHRRNGSKGETVVYETPAELRYACRDNDHNENHNLQWAQGKAGEDRVHVVVSEDHGWLFVGIYDGFNGPDAPDFLMSNLYRAVHKELQELLWNSNEVSDRNNSSQDESKDVNEKLPQNVESNVNTERFEFGSVHSDIQSPSGEAKSGVLTKSRTLRELLADADTKADNRPNGAKKRHQSHESCSIFCETLKRANSEPSCSLRLGKHQEEVLGLGDNIGGKSMNRCHTNLDNGIKAAGTTSISMHKASLAADADPARCRPGRVSTTWTEKSFVGAHFMNRQIKNKMTLKKSSPDRNSPLIEAKESAKEEDSKEGEPNLWRHGEVDHDAVLKALARALELTEEAYLAMADRALDENPELALMGSCILVALMKDKDVYVLNVGDSRAILAQKKNEHHLLSSFNSDTTKRGSGGRDAISRQDLERISEESPIANGGVPKSVAELGPPLFNSSLSALQLSTDHSTNIQEEVYRIKAEHPDDTMCVFNGRVKGRLKVTRAFGAGFLKKSRWNSAILKMFQIEYIGSDPYVSCTPSLHHHKLDPNDRFLVLSSDGLYQYFSNQEVVSHVEWFLEKFPEGDPAQYLIEELLFRAAKKAGMDFHELLDIPQGDRRKYHDDVSVMVVAIDGRIWRSSG